MASIFCVLLLFSMTTPLVTAQLNCVNTDVSCDSWARNGQCASSSSVRDICRLACKICDPTSLESLIKQNECEDQDPNCRDWASNSTGQCQSSEFVRSTCKKSCGSCKGPILKEYDLRRLPANLRPLAFLVGKWRSEFNGKIRFPTIPVFTYGEELDVSIAATPVIGAPALNYSAFAWGINQGQELHSEYGFLVVKGKTNKVAFTSVMNNGFTTVEEGELVGNRLVLNLKDIARITFSRDLPVQDLRRELVLIDTTTLEQRILMETVTHRLQEHAYIRYRKIYP